MKKLLRIPFFLLTFATVTPALAQQTVGLFLNDPTSFNGYTLFGNNEKSYLIDNCGFTVNTWESQYDPGLAMYLLEDGNLLRTAKVSGDFSGGGLGGRFELFSWEGDLLWSYEYAGNSVHAHHDIEPLPNGNFLVLAWEKHSQSDAQQNGRAYNGEVWSERIVEIEMAGTGQANIVWEWQLWDHLVQDADNSKPNYGLVAAHPELVDLNYIGEGEETSGDWIHANAIAYNESLDQIAISSRNFSEIWIIDHSTSTAEAAGHSGGNSGKGGDLLYRFGNPQTYQRGTPADQLFFNQHDVRWIPEGYPQAGKLMVFNNDAGPGSSRVEIWAPPLNANGSYNIIPGEPFGPAGIDWQYEAAGFYSDNMSGAHMLPNGNVLICEGDDGLFFELTPGKERVWEYVNPVNRNGGPTAQGGTVHFNDTFRATKYTADYPAFEGKTLMPGPPVEINPWDSDCEIHETVTGTSLRGNFEAVKILGNPAGEVLVVRSGLDSIDVKVLNTAGIVIARGSLSRGDNHIDLHDASAGIYLILLTDGDGKRDIRKIVLLR